MEARQGKATVTPVKSADAQSLRFDGQKADMYINTGRLNGQHFLVKVEGAGGAPTLIAIHL